jgi:FkbM family methyltransferase
VIIHNAAVSSRHGISKMRVPSGNFYRANISPDGDQPVELVRLDDEFARIGRVVFIKCDAEFHEPEVIEGAIELIRRDHPVWLIETWNHDVIKRMVEFGYHATKLEHDWLFHMENSFTARDH